MAINLQSKMHEMYKDDIVTKDITGVIGKILQEQEKRVTELDQQRLLGYATWFLDNIEKEYATYKIEKSDNEKNKEICRGINYVNLIIMFIINLMFLILGFSELSRVVFYLIIYATVLLEVLIRVYIFYVKSWNK